MARNVKKDAAGVQLVPRQPKVSSRDRLKLEVNRLESASTAYMKAGRERRNYRKRETGVTFTTSFTLTRPIDQMVHDIAMEDGISRSAVVRAALLSYGVKRGYVE